MKRLRNADEGEEEEEDDQSGDSREGGEEKKAEKEKEQKKKKQQRSNREAKKTSNSRPHKLHPSHPAQKLNHQRINTLQPRAQGHAIKASQDLDILALCKAISVRHGAYLSRKQRVFKLLDPLEEDDDLVGRPAGDVVGHGDVARRRSVGVPFIGQRVAGVDEGGVEGGLRGIAGGVEPGLPVDGVEFVGGGGMGGEKGKEGGLEVGGVDRFAGKGAKVVRYKGVPGCFANELFEVEEKGRSLFIGHAGRCIVGVLAVEVHDEFCEFMILPKSLDRIRESFPSDDGGKGSIGLAMELCEYPPLQIYGPAFVQPMPLARWSSKGRKYQKCSHEALLTRFPLQL